VARFLFRRIAAAIGTLLIASVLIFLATNILPGNTAEVVLGRNANGPAVTRLEHELGLDRPAVVRYLSWLGGMTHGDFGQSAVARAEGRPQAAISATIGSPLADSAILAGITAILLIPLTMGFGCWPGCIRGARP
jgi:peptide/nickel transport system permease protein